MSGGSVLALRPLGDCIQRGPQAGSERNPMNKMDARFITKSAVAPFSSRLRFAPIITKRVAHPLSSPVLVRWICQTFLANSTQDAV
jgi:hypothetical protein